MTELYCQETKKENKQNIYSSNPKNIVPVFGPDDKRLKNTNVERAKKWINQKKVIQVKLPNGK